MKNQNAIKSTISLLACAGALINGSASHAQVNATVNVTANPLWTDTEITLAPNETVNISASGTWSFYYPFYIVGPNGYPYIDNFDRFTDNADQGELIAYIGSDPFQGNSGNGNFFPQATGYITVGTGTQFTTSSSGELWLGCNDDAVSQNVDDNWNYVTADINVSAVPEPSTKAVGFLAAALAGVAFFRTFKPVKKFSQMTTTTRQA